VKSTFALVVLALALVVSVSVASAAKETYSLTCDATTATVTWPSGTRTVTFIGTDTSGHVGTSAILTLAKSGPGSFTVVGALPLTIPNFDGTLASVQAVFVTKRGDTGADLTAACS
jgi:hypothetical protein